MKKTIYILAFILISNFSYSNDLTTVIVDASGASSNGSIDLILNAGVAPFVFNWSGPSSFTANTEDITNLIAGTYTVTVTDFYCGIATLTVVVGNGSSTAIAKQSINNTLTIFPNPANQSITVSATRKMENATLKIIDINGCNVLQLPDLNDQCITFNISKLDEGIYFLELNNKGMLTKTKFIKHN